MNNYGQHRTRPRLLRGFSALLALLLTITFSTPSFAACACCDDMDAVAQSSHDAETTEVDTPSCHSAEPVAPAKLDCHSATEPSQPATTNDTLNECTFECARSIAITGYSTMDLITVENPNPLKVPAIAFILPIDTTAAARNNTHANIVPHNLLSLRTALYSSISPIRV